MAARGPVSFGDLSPSGACRKLITAGVNTKFISLKYSHIPPVLCLTFFISKGVWKYIYWIYFHSVHTHYYSLIFTLICRLKKGFHDKLKQNHNRFLSKQQVTFFPNSAEYCKIILVLQGLLDIIKIWSEIMKAASLASTSTFSRFSVQLRVNKCYYVSYFTLWHINKVFIFNFF